MKEFLRIVKMSFVYIWGTIVNPVKTFKELIEEKNNVLMSFIIMIFISGLYFVAYIPAAVWIKTDWIVPLFWRFVKSDGMFRYLLFSFPVYYATNLVVIGSFVVLSLFDLKSDQPKNSSLFSTIIYSTYIPLLLDIIAEWVMVIYLFIVKPAVVPVWFYVMLTILITPLMIWTFILYYLCYKQLFNKINNVVAWIFSVITSLIYTTLMVLWVM